MRWPWAVAYGGLRSVGAALKPPQRFEPGVIEAAFLNQQAQGAAAQRRAGCVLALFVWLAYAVFESNPDPIHPQLWMLQALGAAALAITTAFASRPQFKTAPYAERLIVIAAVACFSVLLRIVAIDDLSKASSLSFIGEIIYLLFICTMFRLRAAVVAILLLACLVSSAINALAEQFDAEHAATDAVMTIGYYVTSLCTVKTLITAIYQIAFVLIGYVTVVELERGARRAFLRERQLADAYSELQATRLEVEKTTRALIAAEEALRVKAEQANRIKSKFLADAAHDLSQPMHAVSLLVESVRHALARQDLPKGSVLVETAGRAVRAARSSFSAVLEISQLESGLVHPTYGAIDLDTLLAEVVAQLQVIADAQGVSLHVRVRSAGPAMVRSDRALLGRAIANLISNAIKYADPAKGDRRTVLLGVVQLSGHTRIDVLDNGVGISPSLWDEVFKPFVQLNNPERNRERGMGLGLSIVRAIVDLLEGHKITIRSDVGSGSRFSLTAPTQSGRPSAHIAEGLINRTVEDMGNLFVWCVEDDEIALEATVALLDELGVLNQHARSLDQLRAALEIHERAPDLVITDYRLKDGRTAEDVANVFAARWGAAIPILIMTGEASGVGADMISRRDARVLRKPVAPELFISTIRELCLSPQPGLEREASVPGAPPRQ